MSHLYGKNHDASSPFLTAIEGVKAHISVTLKIFTHSSCLELKNKEISEEKIHIVLGTELGIETDQDMRIIHLFL